MAGAIWQLLISDWFTYALLSIVSIDASTRSFTFAEITGTDFQEAHVLPFNNDPMSKRAVGDGRAAQR
jgi:hypothetical protein